MELRLQLKANNGETQDVNSRNHTILSWTMMFLPKLKTIERNIARKLMELQASPAEGKQ